MERSIKVKLEVLCITDYFLPGFHGGGPIRTLDNMRKQLTGQVTLSIFTRDRDLGSSTPYPSIEPNQWTETLDGPIFYAQPDVFGSQGIKRALSSHDFDILYLNSFFSPRSSLLPYLALRRSPQHIPILLAPRGEFSPGALAIKKGKKRAFLWIVRFLRLYRDVSWHASTEREAQDILRQFPYAEGKIHIAPDPVIWEPPDKAIDVLPKKIGQLHIAFISRISPKKNLDGLLKFLNTVRAPVTLGIFGPVEDEDYWQQCKETIAALPDNIKVAWNGPLAPEEVSPTFARYDLFAFPTHGENFGHVIFEALRAGTPVLLSDQTFWHPDDAGAVTTVPLSDQAGWRRAIEQAADRTLDEQASLRSATLDYAARYTAADGSLRANLEMFSRIIA